MVTNTFKQASPGIPGVGKIMLFMLNALKEHNGKATEEQIQNETIEKIVKERRISSKDRSDLHSEIVRLEDLLLRAGLLAKQGFRALVLTPRALILNDEQIKALPQDPELIEQSLIAEESEARVLPPLPAVDDVAVFLATQLQSQRLAEIELDEQTLRLWSKAQSPDQADKALMHDLSWLNRLRLRARSARNLLLHESIIDIDAEGRYFLSEFGSQLSSTELRERFPHAGSFVAQSLRDIVDRLRSRARKATRLKVLRQCGFLFYGLILDLFRPRLSRKLAEKYRSRSRVKSQAKL